MSKKSKANILKPQRVLFPTFQLAANPVVNLRDIKARSWFIDEVPHGKVRVWDAEEITNE